MRPPALLRSAAVLLALLPSLSGCVADDPILTLDGGDAGGAEAAPSATAPTCRSTPGSPSPRLLGPVDVVRDKYMAARTSTPPACPTRCGSRVTWSPSIGPCSSISTGACPRGRLSEILSDLSPAAIDLDITYRHIGLARTAKAQYEALGAGP